MNTIAHISDVHIPVMPEVEPRDLINKRVTGYLNWRLRRTGKMSLDSLNQLVHHLRQQRPDFTAVTGDLVNLALPAETDYAAQWLKRLGPAERVGFVPGNHDAYVRGGVESAKNAYGPYASGETLGDEHYPYVRRIGEVAIIGCTSAVPTPPFISAGNFDEAQAKRLAKCLDVLGEAGYFRTILIHHPPTQGLPPRQRLYGARRFRDTVTKHGAELVLHGHTHQSTLHSIEGGTKPVPVVGVTCASTAPGNLEAPARYNLFQIQRLTDSWSCTMREFGYQRIGDDIVQRLQVRII